MISKNRILLPSVSHNFINMFVCFEARKSESMKPIRETLKEMDAAHWFVGTILIQLGGGN